MFPCFNSLHITGVTGISSAGLNQWLKSFTDTLIDLEMALCDQEEMKADFFESLGQCKQLETLDVTGCYEIDDAMQMNFEKGMSKQVGEENQKPGWHSCHTAKLCGAGISDIPLMAMGKAMPNLEHLEIPKCEKVTEFGLKSLLETNTKLQFLDINHIPAVTFPFLDELKDTHPQLLIKRHAYQDVDFKKDNGLRVPRRLLVDIKKKKKKKGGKKKKK